MKWPSLVMAWISGIRGTKLNARNRSREQRQPAPLVNADAEKIVIGKILNSEATYWNIAGTLNGFHFAFEIHQQLFNAYRLIVMDGRKPSLTFMTSPGGPENGDGGRY